MRQHRAGFTLTELAIVLVIVAILLGGLLVPLSVQYDSANAAATQKSLADVREALIGYAVANGRLPCPAKPPGGGNQGVEGGTAGVCTNSYDGFVPAITLGLQPQNANGYLVDAWGNPLHYAVWDNAKIGGVSHPFTVVNGMQSATMGSISGTQLLHVCASATGTSSITCGSAIALTNDAPALVFSTGKNGPNSHGTDEAANLAGNPVFVAHDPTPAPGEFDDLVVWLSTSILFNRMVAAGRLP
jgi:prepilin-type N-terminal cleavage/methylation domain-containing protein